MEFTINCSRVPIPQGTTLYGIPVDEGLAPASKGPVSNYAVPQWSSNDGDGLNSSERPSPNEEESGPGQTTITKQLVNCTKYTNISTFNALTLGPLGRIEELGENAKLQNIDIIAIQEHRFYHPNDRKKYHTIGSYQLVSSSAWKNSTNSTIGGNGCLLSSKASDNLLSVEPISPRIMVLELDGNPKTTIVCVYSPINTSPIEEIEEFYSTLRSTIEQVPRHNFLVIAGDLNAQLGTDEVKFSFHTKTNRNGKILMDFLQEFDLFASNTNFMKPKGQMWTFEYPSGVRAQLDYVIFRKKWRNSIKDSRAYSSFSSVQSDHRIVSATVKLSLRSSKKAKPHPMKTIDWKEVSSNPVISKQFTVDVFNKFQPLSNSDINSDNIDDIYNNLIKSTEEVALATLPKKKNKGKNKPSQSPTVTQAREHLKTVSLAYHRSPSTSLKIQLISAKKDLEDAYLNAEVDFVNGKISQLSNEHISRKHHLAWKTIKDLSGKSSGSSVRIKGGSAKKRLDNWLTHFQNLLGKPAKVPDIDTLPSVPVSDTLNINTSSFTLSELNSATKQLKASKAFGPDNIPAIIWKDKNFHELLLKLCNHTFHTLNAPKIWHQSQIIPMPKKGDLSLVTNYRGISLMSIAAKIYNKMILNRLVPHVEPLLRKNQNGFRRGRSTLSQILCLRRIIEECKLSNRDLALVFVDFSKAFDSIDRNKIFEILKLYGIPDQIISAIKVLYTNTTSTVLSPDGETSPFSIEAGILQGDTLAPFLFIIVVDYVLRMSVDTISNNGLELSPRRSSRYPAKYLTDTDFADDIALVSQSLLGAQSLLQSLEQASNCVGLHLNETKTECINMCSSDTDFIIKTLNNTLLKMVSDYVYLGSYISSSEKDFLTRKGMAWSACNALHKIWSSNLTRAFKLKIFKAAIEPILLYGSETWTLSKNLEKRLDGTFTRLLMRVQNISWKRHPTKQQIYGSIPPVSNIVRARRVQFAGHCCRAEGEVISSLLLWKPPSQSRRGRKLSYPDTLARDTGIEHQDLCKAMKDRELWRDVVDSMVSTKVET